MKLEIPKFENKKDLFDFLIENKDTLIAQKKAEMKEADAVLFVQTIKNDKLVSNKANEPIDVTAINELKVIAIINTTNLMDSHDDVHLPGLWKKSISENKFIMHVQEHKRNEFDKIIAEGKDLKVYTKTFSWVELGASYEGNTQALVFESIVRKDRNPFMFNQYAKGWVKNHSVGMRYVQLVLAVNDDNYGAEYEAWNKYISKVANRERAEERGYFYVVKEAKIIEGSAVPLGSNPITPTLENNKELSNLEKEIQELKGILKDIQPLIEPLKNTQKQNTEDLEFLKMLNKKI